MLALRSIHGQFVFRSDVEENRDSNRARNVAKSPKNPDGVDLRQNRQVVDEGCDVNELRQTNQSHFRRLLYA